MRRRELQLPALATDLVRRQCTVIIASGEPAAHALGIEIPPTLLARADEVIE